MQIGEHTKPDLPGDGWVIFDNGLEMYWKIDVDSKVWLIRPHDHTRLNRASLEAQVEEALREMR